MTAFYVLLAAFILKEAFNFYERSKMLNRLMARNLGEFKYYEDKWKNDLEVIKKAQDADVKAVMEKSGKKESEVDLSNFEEFAAEAEDDR